MTTYATVNDPDGNTWFTENISNSKAISHNFETRLAFYRSAELLMKIFPGEPVDRVIKMLLMQAKQLKMNATADKTQEEEIQRRIGLVERCLDEIF